MMRKRSCLQGCDRMAEAEAEAASDLAVLVVKSISWRGDLGNAGRMRSADGLLGLETLPGRTWTLVATSADYLEPDDLEATSGIGGPVPRSGHETAQAILGAAVRQMGEVGVHSLRVDEVLAEANASTGSFRHHFGTRDGLITATQYERYLRTALGESQDHLAAADLADTTEEFCDFIASQLVRIADDPVVRTVRRTRVGIISDSFDRPELLSSLSWLQHQLFLAIVPIFDRAKAKGIVNPNLDSYTYTAWFHGMTLGRSFTEETVSNSGAWLAIAIPAALAPLRP